MKKEKTNFNGLIKLFFALLVSTTSLFAQKKEKVDPAIAEAVEFVAEGNKSVEENNFSIAEASYRKAIAKDPNNIAAKYNAGNNYYRSEKYDEGLSRYLQAVQVASTKTEKHRAFHNLGNAYYQKNDFKQAVEAYKNALRSNPTDEETRYNLAMAKKEDEKNGSGGEDNKEDKKEDQQNDKQQDQDKDGDGKEQEGDDGKPKEKDEKGEDKKGEGEDQKDEDGKPKDDQGDKGGEDQKDQKDQKQPQPQQGEGQLSPQQVKSLLEAMKNEENKVQQKINAKKAKGVKVKAEKDW